MEAIVPDEVLELKEVGDKYIETHKTHERDRKIWATAQNRHQRTTYWCFKTYQEKLHPYLKSLALNEYGILTTGDLNSSHYPRSDFGVVTLWIDRDTDENILEIGKLFDNGLSSAIVPDRRGWRMILIDSAKINAPQYFLQVYDETVKLWRNDKDEVERSDDAVGYSYCIIKKFPNVVSALEYLLSNKKQLRLVD